jgi:fucose permease
LQLGLIVSFYFLYGGAENSLGGWIHTYGIMRNGMNPAVAAYLTSAFWGAFTLGRLLAIPLTTRFRPGTLVLTQLSISCVLVMLLLFSPVHPATTWTLTILIGLCWSSVFPLSLAFLDRITAGSGRITSWFFVGASSGAMALPWFVGQFIEIRGPQFFVWVLMVSITFGTVILFRIAANLKRATGERQ